ncbi:MAG: hypothetical protein U7123_08535 [Potamolinea sp.]
MPRWTPEARMRQSELAKITKPWKHSSGPQSRYGKWVASQNARKGKLHQSASFVSPLIESDKIPEPSQDEDSRPLAVADYVIYVGDWAPTLQQCRGEPMMVLGFSNGAVACQVGGGILWIYPVDLEQCDLR